MTAFDKRAQTNMPTPALLPMPTQDLSRPFRDKAAPTLVRDHSTRLFRWATFIPAILTTFFLIIIFSDWFQSGGFNATEIAMVALVGFSAFWIALSVATGTVGLFFAKPDNPAKPAASINSMRVALLVPIYNEEPEAVFRRIAAMRDQLSTLPSSHRFAFFVLSDTRDDRIALQESKEFERLRRMHRHHLPIFYRRRADNIERKTGNIRSWITNWGAPWDAFITLDADSLMSSQTITRLADELAAAPDTALIQTVPQLVSANTLFSRIQQFSNNAYGGLLAKGLDRWSGSEGNYWGHNAIVRTLAFAACAGLPKLSGKGALGGTIKSHDFVEAALLRRAGWAVRLLPDLSESYEETPQSMIDYVLRDRRWCQGNLQHLRLLGAAGLKSASRFHMLQGAMAYIASVGWFGLLILWALMGRSEEQNVIRYFTDTNPLFPQWPEMDAVSRLVVLVFIIALLLTPKLFAILDTIWRDPTCRRFGGIGNFMLSALAEIVFSFLLAPILMIQHVSGVFKTIIGFDTGWSPQNRNGGIYIWKDFLRFHWLETTVGTLLSMGLAMGVISLWLLPIAFSLIIAAPISCLFGKPLPKGRFNPHILATPETIGPAKILVKAGNVPDRSNDPADGERTPRRRLSV